MVTARGCHGYGASREFIWYGEDGCQGALHPASCGRRFLGPCAGCERIQPSGFPSRWKVSRRLPREARRARRLIARTREQRRPTISSRVWPGSAARRPCPSHRKAGTALDRTNSGAAPPDHLRSCLAGKCSQEAM